MTREEAIETLKENFCAMCAYGSQSMMSCDIRGCDNRDAIKTLEQESCDKCEVGNPCLYCKHEFEPQESEDRETNVETIHDL